MSDNTMTLICTYEYLGEKCGGEFLFATSFGGIWGISSGYFKPRFVRFNDTFRMDDEMEYFLKEHSHGDSMGHFELRYEIPNVVVRGAK